jgi:hypothetical protein
MYSDRPTSDLSRTQNYGNVPRQPAIVTTMIQSSSSSTASPYYRRPLSRSWRIQKTASENREGYERRQARKHCRLPSSQSENEKSPSVLDAREFLMDIFNNIRNAQLKMPPGLYLAFLIYRSLSSSTSASQSTSNSSF